MEGVSGEAGSLAGHQRLDNLCWIYDNNHITIDGQTEITYSDDVAARFMGYGWNVTRVGDANDLELLTRAFEVFKREERPAHPDHRRQPHRLRLAAQAGHRRGARRAAGRRRRCGRPSAPTAGPRTPSSSIPDGVYEHFAAGRRRAWRRAASRMGASASPTPDRGLAAEIDQMQRRELPRRLGRRDPELRRRRRAGSPPARRRTRC